MTFGYLWTLLAICVEQLILSQAYDEYLVLALKSDMTNLQNVVCVLISTDRGVFIGVQGGVTDLVKSVTR
jgi:hypothetical protein